MKKINELLRNKNVITILGLVAILVILYVSYSIRINQRVKLVTVYYALETIQPMTKITEDMIGTTQVPESFLLGKYYSNYSDIEGKYSNYNTMISQGSLFYRDLLITEENLPNSMLFKLGENERLVSQPVNMNSTYGNSMMPGDLIDVYVKLITKEGDIVYGQFMNDIEILAVKDSNGNNVFQYSDSTGIPSSLYFGLPEAKYLLYSSLNYIKQEYSKYDVEIVLVPNGTTITADPIAIGGKQVSSEYLYKFILNEIKTIDSQKNLYDELLNEMKNN